MTAETSSNSKSLYVLALDGGGAKGFYTLGVLKNIEAMVGKPLHERFGLIFGTSTGSIIASLLALGKSVDEILELYRLHVPAITRCYTQSGRTSALRKLTSAVYGEQKFDAFKTNIGLVATKWDEALPMVFKTNVSQAHGRQATFIPGFGCTIADAVQASCSAFPYFKRHKVMIQGGARIELADGGFCANNPTLYAITDAAVSLGVEKSNIHVVSIGVGVYPKPSMNFFKRNYVNLRHMQALVKFWDANTNSMEHLRRMLFKDIDAIRVDETFSHPELAMDFLERDLEKLEKIYLRGGESYAKAEPALRRMLI